MEWAMNEEIETEGKGGKLLMLALVAGAALLFVETTMPIGTPAKTATVQTVSMPVAPADRLARN